jgi:hypothetical protein
MDTSNPSGMSILATASVGVRNGALLVLASCAIATDVRPALRANVANVRRLRIERFSIEIIVRGEKFRE